MKILTFSDSHLTSRFEEKQFNYLSSIIKKADTVILNGDFWDHYATTFDKFVNSDWKHLFPILKKKETIYIYGNHDFKKFSDDRVNLFSDKQTKRHEIKSGNKTFIFEHGNRFFPGMNEYIDIRIINSLIDRVLDPLQYQLVRRFDRKLLQLSLKQTNKLIKKETKKELKPNQIYICGHTHYAELDLKNSFVNSGINNYGLGQHLWIENGNVTLKEEWYS